MHQTCEICEALNLDISHCSHKALKYCSSHLNRTDFHNGETWLILGQSVQKYKQVINCWALCLHLEDLKPSKSDKGVGGPQKKKKGEKKREYSLYVNRKHYYVAVFALV